MSGVKVKIKSIYQNLSEAEKKVADYIFENAEAVPFQTIYEVAGRVKVSVASVSRFTRMLGYARFNDFKIEIAKDSSSSVRDIFKAITPDDSDEEIVRKVFRSNIQSIEDTLKILEFSDLVEVAKIIIKTRRLVFFGIGGSGNVAQDAALRFSHLDIQAEAYIDPLYIIIQAERLKKGEVAFGISHSGRTEITCEALQLAGERGAVTCGISNYLKSPLSNYVRYLFCTSFPEDQVKVAALSSRIAQLCVIDALYLLAARNMKIIWDTEGLNRLTEKLLRIKK